MMKIVIRFTFKYHHIESSSSALGHKLNAQNDILHLQTSCCPGVLHVKEQ